MKWSRHQGLSGQILVGFFFRRQCKQVCGEVPSQYFPEPVKQAQSKWCEEFERLFEGAREGTFYQLEAPWCQLSLNVQTAGRRGVQEFNPESSLACPAVEPEELTDLG